MKLPALSETGEIRAVGPRTPADRLASADSGQAMAEYALLIMLVAANLVFFLPEFINALQRYYDSFYVILNLPIP